MTIPELAQTIQNELDSQKQALVKEQETLQAQAQLLETKSKQLDELAITLDNREKELQKREQTVLTDEGRRALEKVLSQKQEDIAVAQDRLNNDRATLSEAQALVKRREEDVSLRESTVSKREVEYKQTLKDEFFKEVQNRLPQ